MTTHPDTDAAPTVAGRTATRRSATARARSIVGVLLLLAACVSGYAAVHAALGVRSEARELSWLQRDGTRALVTVTDEGWRRPDGSLLQYWARDPAVRAPVFIDASSSPGRTSDLGARVRVVLDPRLDPTTGIPVDALGRSSASDYARRAVPLGALTAVLVGGVFVAGRRTS